MEGDSKRVAKEARLPLDARRSTTLSIAFWHCPRDLTPAHCTGAAAARGRVRGAGGWAGQ